jgi:hypothetical protein
MVPATPADVAAVRERIGREPTTDFEVVVRDDDGAPVVVRNEPLSRKGTPMPTRFWLVDPSLNVLVARLEAAGGVRAAEAEVDGRELAAAHVRYAAERDAVVPPDHEGPRPFGGVGGTRRGVKCLHAHYAWYLAGGDDPVGRWVDAQLRAARGTRSAAQGARSASERPRAADERLRRSAPVETELAKSTRQEGYPGPQGASA